MVKCYLFHHSYFKICACCHHFVSKVERAAEFRERVDRKHTGNTLKESNHVLFTCTPWNNNECLRDCAKRWEPSQITLSEMGNMPLPRQHASKHLLLPGRETSINHHDCCLLCFAEFVSHTPPIHKHILRHVHVFLCVCFSAFRAGALSHSYQKRGAVVLTPNNVTIVAPRSRQSRRQPQCLRERLRDRLNGTMNGPLSAGLVSEVQPWRLWHTHKDTHTHCCNIHSSAGYFC